MSLPLDPSQREESDSATRIDPAIVARLFVDHADELRRFLLGVLRNQEQASDVMQIAFTKAVEVGHLAREESLKGWLFRVAYHEAIALRRRQVVQFKAHHELANRGLAEVFGPTSHALRRETIELVRSALAKLPPEQRQVVELRMYQGKKFAAIAEELGLPLGTVLTRMQLAMTKLKKALAGRQ